MKERFSFLLFTALSSAVVACGSSSDAGNDDGPGSGGTTSASGGASGSGGNAAGGDGSGSAPAGGSSGGNASGGNASSGGSTNGSGGSSALAPVHCESPFADPADYTAGLPLLQSNPGAGLVLFVDYDGGTYSGTSYAGYYTGTAEQRTNIVKSFNYLKQYFAMFDVSVTTDPSKIGAGSDAENWGWIVVTPDYSGGQGKYAGIGKPTGGNAVCSSTTMTNSDRSRRIAHELGHNMNLYHDGLFEEPSTQDLSTGTDTSGGTCTEADGLCFFKFEDSASWNGKYGSMMGGGGEGERNGWGLALFDPGHGGTSVANNLQDEMAKVRKAVRDFGGSASNDGWAIDDHPDDAPSPLCVADDSSLYRIGVLGSPDDTDVFSLDWSGGDLKISWTAPDVSAALVDLDVYRDDTKVGDDTVTGAPPGVYEIHVRSQGDYGAIGYYDIRIE